MLKLCRVTKVKVLFLVLVYVFNFHLFEFLAAILEKGLLDRRLFNRRLRRFFNKTVVYDNFNPASWSRIFNRQCNAGLEHLH